MKREREGEREEAECSFWQTAMQFFCFALVHHPFGVRACAHRLRSSIELPLYNRNECLLLCLWRVDLLFLMLLLIFISGFYILRTWPWHVAPFLHSYIIYTIRSVSFAADYLFVCVCFAFFRSSLISQFLRWAATVTPLSASHCIGTRYAHTRVWVCPVPIAKATIMIFILCFSIFEYIYSYFIS